MTDECFDAYVSTSRFPHMEIEKMTTGATLNPEYRGHSYKWSVDNDQSQERKVLLAGYQNTIPLTRHIQFSINQELLSKLVGIEKVLCRESGQTTCPSGSVCSKSGRYKNLQCQKLPKTEAVEKIVLWSP